MRKTMSVALVLGLTVAALGVYAASSSADESGRTIRLFQRDTAGTYVDLGDPDDSAGDQFIFAGDLFKLEKGDKPGKKIGRIRGTDTTVSFDPEAGDGEGQIVATLVLPDGQITAQGLVTFSQNRFTVAITGGTGEFRKSRGEVEVKNVPDSDDRVVTIRLN